METDPRLAKAIALATKAHEGQEYGGKPYIVHPLRVMRAVADRGYSIDHQIVAVLHDIVEDTDVTVAQIDEEFGPEIAAGVDGITHYSGVSNADYLATCGQNPLSRVAKFFDSLDNATSCMTNGETSRAGYYLKRAAKVA